VHKELVACDQELVTLGCVQGTGRGLKELVACDQGTDRLCSRKW
jgi:hypothetical protein